MKETVVVSIPFDLQQLAIEIEIAITFHLTCEKYWIWNIEVVLDIQ